MVDALRLERSESNLVEVRVLSSVPNQKGVNMRKLSRFLLPVLLLMAFSAGAHAQTRGEFKEFPDGFKVSFAVEKDGTHSLLVLYPDKYLGTTEKYNLGSLFALVAVFGCEQFERCKPALESEIGENGKRHGFVKLVKKDNNKSIKVLIYGLSEKDERLIGAVFMMEVDEIIYN